MTNRSLVAFLASAITAACGGGDGGAITPPLPTPVQPVVSMQVADVPVPAQLNHPFQFHFSCNGDVAWTTSAPMNDHFPLGAPPFTIKVVSPGIAQFDPGGSITNGDAGPDEDIRTMLSCTTSGGSASTSFTTHVVTPETRVDTLICWVGPQGSEKKVACGAIPDSASRFVFSFISNDDTYTGENQYAKYVGTGTTFFMPGDTSHAFDIGGPFNAHEISEGLWGGTGCLLQPGSYIVGVQNPGHKAIYDTVQIVSTPKCKQQATQPELVPSSGPSMNTAGASAATSARVAPRLALAIVPNPRRN